MATAALGLAVVMVVACAAVPVVHTDPWFVRLGAFAAGLAVAGSAAAWLAHYRRRQSQAARRYFDALCGLNPRDLRSDSTAAELRPLPPNHPLAEIADRFRQTVLELCRQVQELEHTRTASEIRQRRAATESAQIKQILSELADPVLAIDDYHELVLTNRSASELFRLDDGDIETRLLADVTQCQKLVELLTATSRRKTSGTRTDDVELTDENGQVRCFRVTASKLAAAESAEGEPGVAGGAVAVLHDVGDQKALQKRNAEFVSAVSHEMKTPLAGIKAYVELLVDGDAEDEETQEEFLRVINSQADRLQRLVENLLNIARIEAGVVNVSKHPQSLNELLEEALNVVQPSAEAKGFELTSDLSPMYLAVLADHDMLLQAAINLLSNAIKYTPKGGSVTLRSRMVDDEVRFEVQDTGVGLSEEDAQRVFEKFYRVKKDKTMASGTGLGLPLAKHIVEDVHAGRLTVTSVLDEGSTFAVTLPSAGQISN